MPPRFLYRLFPWAGAPSRWFSRRFTPSGRLVLGLLLGGALFGIDIRQTIAYQLVGLSFGLITVGMLTSLRWRPKLTVTRVLPDRATAGLEGHYWLEVRNDGRRVETDLLIEEILPIPHIDYERFLNAGLYAETANNLFDRSIGFPRWVAMRQHARGIRPMPLALPQVAPGQTVRLRLAFTPCRRGWIQFDTIELRRPDPLGLFYAGIRFSAIARLLALPQTYPVPNFRVTSGRQYQPGGLSLASAVGDSQEFAGLRDYRSGDTRKHIHWRSYARTGRLVVKEYQDEYFDRHALVVDTELPPSNPALFEKLISVAASIAINDRPRDSLLDVVFIGTKFFQLTAGRGLADTSVALAYLAQASPSTTTDFTQLTTPLTAQAAQLASVILVLGQWNEQRRALTTALRSAGLQTLSIVLTDETVTTSRHEDDAGPFFGVRANQLASDLARVAWDR